MNIILKENETMQDLADRLAESFELVYDIAPVAFWYENLYENGRIKDIHFSGRMREMLGYKSVEEFPDELNTLMTFTHPDDVHLMLDDAIRAGTGEIDRYDVQYRIRRADGSYMLCNATGELVKDHRGVTAGMYGAFIDITEEAELQQEQESKRRAEEMVSAFTREYAVALLISLKDGRYRVLRGRPEMDRILPREGEFYPALKKYIEIMIHPKERARAEETLLYPDFLSKSVPAGQSRSFEFRSRSGGDYVWYRGTFSRLNDGEFLAGFRDCNREVLTRITEQKLLGEYDAIYFADLDSGRLLPARSSRVSSAGAFSEPADYGPTILNFAESVAPEYRQDWVSFSDPEFMRSYLASEDHREYVYELPGAERSMRRFSADVIERDDEGAAVSVLFSFTGIDNERARALRLDRRLAEQQLKMEETNRIIEALAEDFTCVNYVELKADKADDSTVGYRTSELLMRLIPGWEEETRFSKKLGLILEHLVYEPDRERFLRDTRRESVLAALENSSIYHVNTRLVIDGEPRYYQIQFTAIRENGGIAGVVAGLHSVDGQMRKELEADRLKNAEIQLHHEQLRSEVLNYMVDHPNEDPTELLKMFAERIRVLIDCDQVIYRDLEETRIMVNSPAIEESWCVPMEYCLQCEHFDAHHPMYAGGFTEMDNCQEGWQGIPVYHGCPIKSSLTRIVYCDGETAGYLAIHYVQRYHRFTDLERSTLEEFTRILSMSLSRYGANIRARELESVRLRMNAIYSLSDEFDPIYVVKPESGEYCRFESRAKEEKSGAAEIVRGDSVYELFKPLCDDLIYEDDRDRFRAFCSRESLMRVALTGEARESENRWLTPERDGYRWKYNRAVRMLDEQGEVCVVVGVMDTTEAREKEARYREQQRQLQSSLELANQQRYMKSFGEMVNAALWNMTIDDADEVTDVNWSNEFRRMLGFEESESDFPNTVDAWTDRLHPDDRERVECVFYGGLGSRDAADFVYDIEMRLMRKTGEYRWYNAVGRIEYSDTGDRIFYGILFDISRDKQLEQQQRQLEEALSMAQSANRAKTTFLNNMSHDIRTPMNAIIGYAGLAASHIDNKEQVRDYLNKIGQSSDHLLSLINDVLDMSRIESGKMNLNEKEENLPDIIHMLRDIVQHDIRSKRMDFYVDAVDVNDEGIICDKLRLNQVLLNILSNAIKYTPAGGTVAMRVTEKTVKPNGYGVYEFRIKDNGMGMDAEFLKTIYDPFTRMRSSTVSGIQGTGLGMAITKNIIDMMGGSIDIQSEPGKGTEVTLGFEFRLQSSHKEPAEIPDLAGLRALVVDDDINNCISAAKMIKDTGMRDEWCTSGREAVIRAEEAFHRGDLFRVYIIDWLMPDMNGIETTRRIRRIIGDDAPIIILTSYDWADIEDEAREAGVTAFASKPMFPSDLHSLLNRCLGKTAAPAPKAETYDFRGKRVLLAEDNELNREIATDILEEDGFIVFTAEDGDVAVEKLRAAKPGDYDLILMDIQMPRMDGYEATRRIRALGTEISRIPILAMTANAFEEDRRAALEAGMDEHIAKPINIDRLKETLAKYL